MPTFIDPPEDRKKHLRCNVDHYLNRAFASLRNHLNDIHWHVCHAHASAMHRRGRKNKRGQVDMDAAVSEMIMAVATERREMDEAETFLKRMLWEPLEEAAKARAQHG